MPKKKKDEDDDGDFKTPKQPKYASKTPNYTWTEEDKAKVVEGKNKGWKETKIKNNLFNNTKYPTYKPNKNNAKKSLICKRWNSKYWIKQCTKFCSTTCW